jgi:hypothetical protein
MRFAVAAFLLCAFAGANAQQIDPNQDTLPVGPGTRIVPFNTNAPLFLNGSDTVSGSPLSNIVPRNSESFDVDVLKDGQVRISWAGNSDFLNGAFIAFLDKSKKEIWRYRFEQLPLSLTKAPPKEAKYYRMVLTYVNGAVTSMVGPIPAAEEKKPEVKPVDKPTETKPNNGLGGP